MGAGCRVFVGAIGTNLKVWNADGIGKITYAAALERDALLRGFLSCKPEVDGISSRSTCGFGKIGELKRELGQLGALACSTLASRKRVGGF
jgi:hypothetical protein